MAAAVVALGALVVVPASQAVSSKVVKKTVKIGDNFFSPDSLKVPKNAQGHLALAEEPRRRARRVPAQGPKGVKKFHSDLAASGYSFSRTLKKPGKYVVICTIHEEMKMTIRVKK